ncbi:MAG: acyl-protein synthetase [Proteobacteria bacterium]|nr:acyl-protein synthetase [Pseudomonadota bacterium]
MTLLDASPYASRSQQQLVAELERLTAHHLAGCPELARAWPGWRPDGTVASLPYLHVGLFKRLRLLTQGVQLEHQRTLLSSATTGATPSMIVLDRYSSALQARSSAAILRDFLGAELRPLLVLDSARSLLRRGEVTARTAAALSLKPLASAIHFVLADSDDPRSLDWAKVAEVAEGASGLLVYGFTSMLWGAWGSAAPPQRVRRRLQGTSIHFVHSGGWKRLERQAVTRERFDAALLAAAGAGSRVVDYYGLVEQVGIVYPLCEQGLRHVPRWADVLVRDPHTLAPLPSEPGQLQLLNVLSWGAPCHSVLTEDLGQLEPGDCACGRHGPRFRLLGRLPKAELRGCANG